MSGSMCCTQALSSRVGSQSWVCGSKDLVADVLGEEKFAQSLSLEDLRFLFAD